MIEWQRIYCWLTYKIYGTIIHFQLWPWDIISTAIVAWNKHHFISHFWRVEMSHHAKVNTIALAISAKLWHQLSWNLFQHSVVSKWWCIYRQLKLTTDYAIQDWRCSFVDEWYTRSLVKFIPWYVTTISRLLL